LAIVGFDEFFQVTKEEAVSWRLISTLGRREDLLDVSYTIIAKEY
jgi:hypothetical protein